MGSSFDEFFARGGYKPGDEPQAMADWLAIQSGKPILGESESGDVVSALPPESGGLKRLWRRLRRKVGVQ